MKKLILTFSLIVWATTMMAQLGLTCENPIPVNKDYVGRVEAGDELWYTAWTYDLPLHVYFSPDGMNSSRSPELMVDFTCDPGVYTDQKLDSVLQIVEMFGIPMPVEFRCDKVVRDGKVEWDLSIDERYRDQLTEYGLTHNVQAFVKAYFPEGGEIRLTPDQTFQNCMANGRYVNLGDTINVSANDTSTMLILPFSEWKNDSIQFKWIGDQPARVWVAEEECQFTPVDASIYIKAKYDLDNNTVKKLYTADMQTAIDSWIGKGIFFGKVLSDAPGKLVVERIPLSDLQGGVTLLKHGQSIKLKANDSRVFCFFKGWNATEFIANTEFLMSMHVSNTADFEVGDANVLTVYPFTKDGNKRQLQLTSSDIASLATSATDDYLYVRFICNSGTTLTPLLWNASSCIDKTILIPIGESRRLAASDKNVYRVIYDDVANYDLTMAWGNKNVSLSAYVASYCDFVTSATDKLKTIVVKKNSSTNVSADEVDSWANSIEQDGFMYLRFSTTRAGDVTITSSRPAEEDPSTPAPIDTTITDTICYGVTYVWNGQKYTTSGEYQQEFTATNGADSIVTLNLLVLPEVKPVVTDVTIEYGKTYEWNDKVYAETITDTITLQDANGCDYLAILKLTVNAPKPVYNSFADTVCYGVTYEWNGQKYTTSGEYQQELTAANGADSIVTLNLLVLPEVKPVVTDVTIEYGKTYEWNDKVYAETTTDTITLQDANGCDYLAILKLTVNAKPVGSCVHKSIELKQNYQLVLNLDSAFTVYRINYSEWAATGATLTWSGTEPLHTFVAETCEFNVAPYNKYVHAYVSIPAEGVIVLDKASLAELAAYVDENGYLYIRFLTEKEGVLEVK